MNKKGFTLIELLIIIGLLALMAGLFSVNMTRILNNTNASNESEVYTELNAATDVYLAINKERIDLLNSGASSIAVSIRELKSEGLISKDYSVNGRKLSDDTKIKVSLGSKGELVFNIEMSD